MERADYMMPVFPFSAVIGQERLKLALLLCAIDPAIGGLLVQGPRGVAKTTLARAFAELLPGRFVELPLGATEERVTGTLDLDAALEGRRVQFSPGLLARAHQGVLYVDEANLLPDPLVDLLLDAAASGQNIVERDGVSHTHPARFVLIGTMNPEEGELRAQFVDRFGLSVSAEGCSSPEERAQIVLQRLEFDRDAESFVARFEAEQRLLIERCRRARERAAQLSTEGPALSRVSALCHAAGVEGVRADLAMLRAARAHAAWHERESIALEDVDAVAELALAHRRRDVPSPSNSHGSSGGSSGSGGAGAKGRPDESSAGARGLVGGAPAGQGERSVNDRSASERGESERGESERGESERGESERGALAPVPVRAAQVTGLPGWLAAASVRRGRRPRHVWTLTERRAARRRCPAAFGSVDWFGTLLRCPHPTRHELRYRTRRHAPCRLWIVAIDCSSSMLKSGGLAVAKGVAHALAESAARDGVHVALISFSGREARTEPGSGSRRGALGKGIAKLGAGGGTPLRRALSEAFAVCRRPAYRARDVEKRLVLLTDGRTREDVTDLARCCAELAPVVIDCERGAVRLGRARSIALALSGRYVHVESFGVSARL